MKPVLFPSEYLAERFSANYREAQDKFRRQFRELHDHSRYKEFVYRQTGPEDEKLLTAVAWQGNPDAQRVLVVQSATHGVEGFAGSAIQIDTLRGLAQDILAPDIAILHIHALNAYGFAWLRRVNEDGIDLNRNFIDFNAPLPVNADYHLLAADLLPHYDADWAEADRQLDAARTHMGQVPYELAVTGGQYSHPDGLFYGGNQPSQSRLYLEKIVAAYGLTQRHQLAVVDVHTGLGPFGYGEVICDHLPDSRGSRLARQWYGDSVTEPALGSSTSVPKQGLIDYFWHAVIPDRVCFVTLEFGTYPIPLIIDALRRDHSLHRRQPAWSSAPCRETKALLKQRFYPGTPDWQEMVLTRGRQVILQAINGLKSL